MPPISRRGPMTRSVEHGTASDGPALARLGHMDKQSKKPLLADCRPGPRTHESRRRPNRSGRLCWGPAQEGAVYRSRGRRRLQVGGAWARRPVGGRLAAVRPDEPRAEAGGGGAGERRRPVTRMVDGIHSSGAGPAGAWRLGGWAALARMGSGGTRAVVGNLKSVTNVHGDFIEIFGAVLLKDSDRPSFMFPHSDPVACQHPSPTRIRSTSARRLDDAYGPESPGHCRTWRAAPRCCTVRVREGAVPAA